VDIVQNPIASLSSQASLAVPVQPEASQTSASSQADRAKLVQLAQEFESFFLVQMLRQMREAFTDDDGKEGLGSGTMTDTMDIEFARKLAQTGGIGVASTLQGVMERQTFGTGSTTIPLANGFAPSLLPLATGQASAPIVSVAQPDETEAALPFPLAAPISSSYGYRADPFTGATRFHAGVDIAAAYGREVPSAGGGQVVVAGEQGGYGNTVVIDHGNGIRTRYAHLSSVQVEVGARVNAGTVVGRVGSSGRSTGPHLHFEVLQDGQPVNPAVAATRYAGLLKIQGAAADLSVSQPSVLGVAVGVDDEDSGQ
jgi:murein DD-endopeptidase MepM/ murein hydrolase activator NlpD